MTQDKFSHVVDTVISPARTCFSIEPGDIGSMELCTKAVYVGGAGDLVVMPLDGTNEVVFRNVQAGSILPIRISAVRMQGTTASDLVGLA